MPAYSITEVETLDEGAARRYAELAHAATGHYGGRYLALAAEPAVAEGEWLPQQRVVIIEFPSMEDLRAWYGSPEYAAARAVARTALRGRLLFVQGVEPQAEATVRRFYKALNTGDASVVEEVLSPGWEDIPLPPHTNGSLLISEVEVQATACRDRVDQGLQLRGRGRI